MLRRRRVLAATGDLEILRLPGLDRTGEIGRILVDKFVVIKEIGLDVDATSGLFAIVRRGADDHRHAIVLRFFHIAEPNILDWIPCGQHLVGVLYLFSRPMSGPALGRERENTERNGESHPQQEAPADDLCRM